MDLGMIYTITTDKNAVATVTPATGAFTKNQTLTVIDKSLYDQAVTALKQVLNNERMDTSYACLSALGELPSTWSPPLQIP